MHIPYALDGNRGRFSKKIEEDCSPPPLISRIHKIVESIILNPLIVVDYVKKVIPLLLGMYTVMENLIVYMKGILLCIIYLPFILPIAFTLLPIVA